MVMGETYQQTTRSPPVPVYMVVNRFTQLQSFDDSVLVPRDRVPMMPIPQKPTTEEGNDMQ